MQIQNNVFIVTGGASGLGAATARMIVNNGGKIVLADLQVEAGEKLATELGGKFTKCDVTSETDGKAAIRTTPYRLVARSRVSITTVSSSRRSR